MGQGFSCRVRKPLEDSSIQLWHKRCSDLNAVSSVPRVQVLSVLCKLGLPLDVVHSFAQHRTCESASCPAWGPSGQALGDAMPKQGVGRMCLRMLGTAKGDEGGEEQSPLTAALLG